MFRHRIRRIGRNVYDMHLAEGGPDIHVIIARGAESDDPDSVFVQLFYDIRIHRIVNKYADSITALCQFSCILCQFCLQELKLHMAGF